MNVGALEGEGMWLARGQPCRIAGGKKSDESQTYEAANGSASSVKQCDKAEAGSKEESTGKDPTQLALFAMRVRLLRPCIAHPNRSGGISDKPRR